MTSDEVREMLRRACVKSGSQSMWCWKHKLSGAYINLVIRGKQEPGPAILKALGLRRVITYEKVRK